MAAASILPIASERPLKFSLVEVVKTIEEQAASIERGRFKDKRTAEAWRKFIQRRRNAEL
jgi:hypothetical protein